MPCSLLLLLGCFLIAEVAALALLTKFCLAETAPQAIWHLPLLTAGASPQSVELHLPQVPGLLSFANSFHDASRGLVPQDAYQGSYQGSSQASFCPESKVVPVDAGSASP